MRAVSTHPSDVLDGLVAAGREPGGAVAVVRGGTVEVEHCAGTRDGAAPWTSDTLVMTFSVAKPFAALTFLDAVAEGLLELDQRVTSLWPEFGQAGKESTTMRHLLAHQAGLPAFPEEARPGGRGPRGRHRRGYSCAADLTQPAASMFFVTTSRVCCNCSVGLNSTTSVLA